MVQAWFGFWLILVCVWLVLPGWFLVGLAGPGWFLVGPGWFVVGHGLASGWSWLVSICFYWVLLVSGWSWLVLPGWFLVDLVGAA